MNSVMLNKIALAWDLNSFLDSLGGAMQNWGRLIMVIIGVAMLIAAAFFIAKGLMSQGRGQTNWALVILLLVVGGVFFAGGAAGGGWDTFINVSNGMNDTFNELGGNKKK